MIEIIRGKVQEAFGLDKDNPVRPLPGRPGWFVMRRGTKVLVTKRKIGRKLETGTGTEGSVEKTLPQ
jgi:hypothetical protein